MIPGHIPTRFKAKTRTIITVGGILKAKSLLISFIRVFSYYLLSRLLISIPSALEPVLPLKQRDSVQQLTSYFFTVAVIFGAFCDFKSLIASLPF